jgi:hypothetical protein
MVGQELSFMFSALFPGHIMSVQILNETMTINKIYCLKKPNRARNGVTTYMEAMRWIENLYA